jgi:Tfp pilus assembly protein PilW
MKNIFWDHRAFTLSELVMAALFGMIVIGSLYSFYTGQLFNLLSQETKTATLQDARGALDLMVRELRNAGAWAAGSAPAGCSGVVTATSTTIRIQADLDGNGDCSSSTGEDVTYSLAGATSTCPGATLRRNGDCLTPNVVIPSGGTFLTYYDAGSAAPLAPPISDLSVLRRVKITLGVQVKNPNPEVGGMITSNLSSSVEFRNLPPT